MEARGIPYVVGGGIAVWAYGRHRDTKDIDLFLKPSDVDAGMNALVGAGYFTSETEKSWLYKAEKQGVGVDFIIRSAGGFEIDEESFDRAEWHEVMGHRFRMMCPEDVIMRKIFSYHDGRPDWFDAISVLESTAGRLDWDYMARHIRHRGVRALSFFLFARTFLCDTPIPWHWIEKLMEEFPESAREWEMNTECKSVAR